jgi:hypothetical protein
MGTDNPFVSWVKEGRKYDLGGGDHARSMAMMAALVGELPLVVASCELVAFQRNSRLSYVTFMGISP